MYKESRKERASRKASNQWFKKEMRKKKKWTYKSYLLSKDWKKKRALKLKSVGNKCQCCGSIYRLQIHHKTYKRLFKEPLSDLVVLCPTCHRITHGLLSEEEIQQKADQMMLQEIDKL